MSNAKSAPANRPRRTRPNLPKRESARRYAAFIYYWGLGDKRSLRKVGEEFGAGINTVKGWSSVFDWKNRLGEMDRRASDRLAEAAVNEAAKIKKAHLKITANLTGRLMQFLKEHEDVSLITSMQDFERLVKTQLLLMDQPTEIIDHAINVISAVPSSKPK